MKVQDLRPLSNDELVQKLKDTEDEYFKKKFQHQANPIKNTDVLRNLRKGIAKIKTIINEKK
ncbi:50S ribosomal protein L29 [bacterium]